MSDLFTRLAARTLGTARILTPQLPGLFEPQGASRDGFVEEAEERAAAVHTARSDVSEPARPAPEPVAADPPVAPLPAPPPTPVEPAQFRTERTETRIEREVTHDHHVTRHDTVTHVRQVAEEEHSERRDDPPQQAAAPVPPDAETPAPVADPSPDPALPLASEPRVPVDPPAPAPPLPPPVVEVRPVTAPQVQAPPAPPERRVDVHIGHLEIRAAPPPVRPARTRSTPKNPAPDLNTYLGDRR